MRGATGVVGSRVYVKGKDGHFAHIGDGDQALLQRIIRWDLQPKLSGRIL